MTFSCPICSDEMKPAFSATVLGWHEAFYDFCHRCGFMRVRAPHWLDEAYSSAIALTDTGLVMRNVAFSRKLASLLYWVFGARADDQFLDAAAGYGMLVRLMRDQGFDFYWADKFCENLMARGFEYESSLGPCAAVTAVEIMEHVEEPVAFVCETLDTARSSTFIFTTNLFEGSPPPRDWWYYSFETGQHISFFQRRTLGVMAERLGLSFVSAGGLHAFTNRPVNRVAFRLFAGRLSGYGARLAGRRLRSRTMTDHEAMGRRLRDITGFAAR